MKKNNDTPRLFNIPVSLLLIGLTLIIISGSIGYLIGSQGTSAIIIKTVTPTMSPAINPSMSPTLSACVTAGCSGQLCVDASKSGMVTTCEYKAEYACLKYSKCELQPNGQCGWTPNQQYIQCIDQAKSY